jgi:uncharacterized membrane-anchored protein YjiN (DUF445 family)
MNNNKNNIAIVGLILIGIFGFIVSIFNNNDAVFSIVSAVVGGLAGYLARDNNNIDNIKEKENNDDFILE